MHNLKIFEAEYSTNYFIKGNVSGDYQDFKNININSYFEICHYEEKAIGLVAYKEIIADGVFELMEFNSVLKAYKSRKISKSEIIEFNKFSVKLREKDQLLSIKTKNNNHIFTYLDALILSDKLSKIISRVKIIN